MKINCISATKTKSSNDLGHLSKQTCRVVVCPCFSIVRFWMWCNSWLKIVKLQIIGFSPAGCCVCCPSFSPSQLSMYNV